jgi:hypothetical protein
MPGGELTVPLIAMQSITGLITFQSILDKKYFLSFRSLGDTAAAPKSLSWEFRVCDYFNRGAARPAYPNDLFAFTSLAKSEE